MPFTTKWYRHDMTGAPSIGNSDTLGNGAALLKALLIDGFNPQVPTTIEYTAGEIVATFGSSHGFLLHQIVTISGADEAGYNGEFRVVEMTDTVIKMTAADPGASPATTSTAFEIKTSPVGGWTLIGDNASGKVAFRRDAVEATPYDLVLENDTNSRATASYGAVLSDVHIVENYVDIDTWDSKMVYTWPMSSRYATSGEEWFFVGDHLMFYWTTRFATGNRRSTVAWGDINTITPGDEHHCVMVHVPNRTDSRWNNGSSYPCHQNFSDMNSTYYKNIVRGYEGTPDTTQGVMTVGIESNFSSTNVNYPNPASNEFMVSPLDVMCVEQNSLRGYWPGLVQPLHEGETYHGTILDNFPAFDGEPIMFWQSNSGANNNSDMLNVGYLLTNWRD